MKNVAVFFGGRSVEHDVSVITGNQVIENADKSKYNVFPVYISGKGDWYCGDVLTDTNYYKNFDENDKRLTKVFLEANVGGELKYYTKFGVKTYKNIDVAILAMHGMHGEDGTLQGLFEICDIPYTSATVAGSGVGMDKIIMKCAFAGAGLPVIDYLYFNRYEQESYIEKLLVKTEINLGFPVFVKPSSLGSSIGISKANNADELKDALDLAFSYDRRVLIEKAITEITEINVAVLGYGEDITVSMLEKPITSKEFLNFDEKYLRKSSSKGMASLSRQIPAQIEETKKAQITEMSKTIFRTLDLKGVVRIDYIIDEKQDKVYVNEVNTIPGSFAFYLYEPMGITFSEVIDKCILGAEKQMAEKQKNSYAFDSSILEKVVLGGAKGK